MAILANRVKIRSNLVELSRFTIFLIRKFFALIMVLISCYLLYFSTPRALTNALLETTSRFLSAGILIYQESVQTSKWIYGRLSYFKDLEAENLRLKLELRSLRDIKDSALRFQTENLKLKEILNVAKDIRSKFITAKIIGTAITPFASTATIQAGANNGIKINDIVRGEFGLIGRVSEVSDNYSTVMLVGDHNSRIPIVTGESKVRGILAKQGDSLKIIYLKDEHNMKPGEIIYTSGDGKLYPKGIAVATIKNITNEGVFVQTVENLQNIEFTIVESKLD